MKRKHVAPAVRPHLLPIIDENKQVFGIFLSVIAWSLFAVFTYAIDMLNQSFSAHLSAKSLSKTLLEFTLIHFVMTVIFFCSCLKEGGASYLYPKEPILILWRSIAAVISFWCYAFSRIWTSTIDNSLQYSTDALWILLIVWHLKHQISVRAAMGIILSFMGIIYVYFADSRSLYDVIGGVFGVSAGFTLAVITVITAYLVKKDPPIRIGFYQSILGLSFFLPFSLLLGLIDGFDFPSLLETAIALMTGVVFSVLLYMLWQSFYYTKPHILGAVSYILPLFLLLFGWLFEKKPINQATLRGTLLITTGSFLAISSLFTTRSKRRKGSRA